MKDEVLDKYVRMLITMNIDNDMFEQYINIFSKYLGYVNSDYKYNVTYLNQYIDECLSFRNELIIKNEKYEEIYNELCRLKVVESFEVIIDRVFNGKFSVKKKINDKHYLCIDKEQIINESIEVKVIVNISGNDFVFCKKYSGLEDKISLKVCDDIKTFIKLKGR